MRLDIGLHTEVTDFRNFHCLCANASTQITNNWSTPTITWVHSHQLEAGIVHTKSLCMESIFNVPSQRINFGGRPRNLPPRAPISPMALRPVFGSWSPRLGVSKQFRIYEVVFAPTPKHQQCWRAMGCFFAWFLTANRPGMGCPRSGNATARSLYLGGSLKHSSPAYTRQGPAAPRRRSIRSAYSVFPMQLNLLNYIREPQSSHLLLS